jgi:hypothetical protein
MAPAFCRGFGGEILSTDCTDYTDLSPIIREIRVVRGIDVLPQEKGRRSQSDALPFSSPANTPYLQPPRTQTPLTHFHFPQLGS